MTDGLEYLGRARMQGLALLVLVFWSACWRARGRPLADPPASAGTRPPAPREGPRLPKGARGHGSHTRPAHGDRLHPRVRPTPQRGGHEGRSCRGWRAIATRCTRASAPCSRPPRRPGSPPTAVAARPGTGPAAAARGVVGAPEGGGREGAPPPDDRRGQRPPPPRAATHLRLTAAAPRPGDGPRAAPAEARRGPPAVVRRRHRGAPHRARWRLAASTQGRPLRITPPAVWVGRRRSGVLPSCTTRGAWRDRASFQREAHEMRRHHRNAAGVALLVTVCTAFVAGCGKSGSPVRPVTGAGASSGASTAHRTRCPGRDLQVADSLTRGPCNPFGLPLGIRRAALLTRRA